VSAGAGAAEARLASLLEQYDLPASTGIAAQALLELWATDPLASTTVTDPLDAVDRHLADSWVALEFAEVRKATAIADLGSGAGIPGLPLAIALPQADVALVESVGRRTVFMETAIEACGVGDRVRPVITRAESWHEKLGQMDLVTARALAALDVVFEYAAPLLRIGGSVLAWKGAIDEQERAAGGRAAEILGLELREERRVTPFEGARAHRLILATKVKETPEKFPRREGVARRKPIGTPSF
jgi:16S rRNA (guanine527-N7)-methyltransferase